MPILRLNAASHELYLNGSPASAHQALSQCARGSGPVIIMIHGFKYDPFCPQYSPHSTIFALKTRPDRTDDVLWPRHLGFGLGHADEGLALAFGWRARGPIWQARRQAQTAARQLADVICQIKTSAPARPVHILSHSMGSEVALEALRHLPSESVKRILALTGASYRSRAMDMLQTQAGKQVEFFNVMSRENDIFDFAFERLIAPPVRGDRALGCGLDSQNAVNIQLDCLETLAALRRFNARITPSTRRVCHWSGYTRPGALAFYAQLMRNPDRTELGALKAALPSENSKRWWRLGLRDPGIAPLPNLQSAAC